MTTFTTEDREWAYWHNYNLPKYNRQTEIDFFWPLTEQVPLDLDYTNCERPKLTVSNSTTGITLLPVTTGTTWVAMEINPTKLTVDVENITFKQKVKPNWFRRIVYKIIGVQWEIK